MSLQAEYWVRVTHEKYLSRRLDPCFIGRTILTTTRSDAQYARPVPRGLHQTTPLRPLDTFIVMPDQVPAHSCIICANLFELWIDECLAELPKIIAEDPTDLTPYVFPNLSSDQQKVFLSILMSANTSKDASLFARLDRVTIHHIFCFQL
jgi:hypothetical protein